MMNLTVEKIIELSHMGVMGIWLKEPQFNVLLGEMSEHMNFIQTSTSEPTLLKIKGFGCHGVLITLVEEEEDGS